jgi:hypothetical protein
MEFFSESHADLMLGVEWLVKVDPEQSKPYLFVRAQLRLTTYSPQTSEW